MTDYRDDLDRFLNAWEQVQRDMQAQERLQELADRNGLSVEDVQATLERIDQGFRRLGISRRPTRAENVELALKHGNPDAIREGQTLSVHCPDCGGELQANKRFERGSRSLGEPEMRVPFWSTTCAGCGHRFNYSPGSGEIRRFES